MAELYFSIIQAAIPTDFSSDEMDACIAAGKAALGDVSSSSYTTGDDKEAGYAACQLAIDNLSQDARTGSEKVVVRLAGRISELLAITEAP